MNAAKTIRVRYLLVDAESSHNILLGRSSLNKLGAIVSTPHLAMKFPSDSKSRSKNVVTLHSYQKTARECYAASLRILPPAPRQRPEVHQVATLHDFDPRPNDEPHVEPKEETVLWQLGKLGQNTRLGSTLGERDQGIITRILAKNSDLFT